jgi:hypothetical protein
LTGVEFIGKDEVGLILESFPAPSMVLLESGNFQGRDYLLCALLPPSGELVQ